MYFRPKGGLPSLQRNPGLDKIIFVPLIRSCSCDMKKRAWRWVELFVLCLNGRAIDSRSIIEFHDSDGTVKVFYYIKHIKLLITIPSIVAINNSHS